MGWKKKDSGLKNGFKDPVQIKAALNWILQILP